MFLTDWIYHTLVWLGLVYEDITIAILGIDHAERETLLHTLGVDGQVAPRSLIAEEHVSDLMVNHVRFLSFDIDGRDCWRAHSAGANGVVYVVDATKPERLAECKAELDGLLGCQELKLIPFLVMGDGTPQALGEIDLRTRLGLLSGTTGKAAPQLPADVRPIELYMCSIARSQGLVEAFGWLSRYIR
jgi:GTP-binding protein SAR1